MLRVKAILTFTAALAFAIAPVVTPGFAGFRPDQFPVPQVDPPIQPAGWSFSIWLVIYVWLIAGTGFGLFRRAGDPEWDGTRWPLLASLVLGTGWIWVATVSPIWATVMIWLMLATAVMAVLGAPRRDLPWLALPIGLYTGWLAAASCVATAILMTGYGMTPVLTVHGLILLVALAIALTLLRLRPWVVTIAAGTGWALIGIVAANLTPFSGIMVALSGVGIVLLTLAVVITLRRPFP